MNAKKLVVGAIAVSCFAAIALAQQPNFFQTTSSNTSSTQGGMTPAPNRSYGAERDPLNYCKLKIIRQAEIPAEEAGVLKYLEVMEGQGIEKGQLVGRIDKTDANLAVEIGKSEYRAAKKTAENRVSIEYAAKAYEAAKADLEAMIQANKTAPGTVTKQQMRSQQLQAERSVMQARMAFEEALVANYNARAKYNTLIRAEAAVQRRDIVSPMNGVIVKKFKHEGEWVQPGESVIKVIQMDRLWVEGDVDGRTHPWHRIMGKKVSITVTLTGGEQRQFSGSVVFASPLIEQNQYTIRAEIENQKENGNWILSPGLDAKMVIQNDVGF